MLHWSERIKEYLDSNWSGKCQLLIAGVAMSQVMGFLAECGSPQGWWPNSCSARGVSKHDLLSYWRFYPQRSPLKFSIIPLYNCPFTVFTSSAWQNGVLLACLLGAQFCAPVRAWRPELSQVLLFHLHKSLTVHSLVADSDKPTIGIALWKISRNCRGSHFLLVSLSVAERARAQGHWSWRMRISLLYTRCAAGASNAGPCGGCSIHFCGSSKENSLLYNRVTKSPKNPA